MERKHFITLLYIFGIVPIMYSISSTLLPNLGRVGFGIINILSLLLWTVIFTPHNTPAATKKRKTILSITGWIIALGLIFTWFTKIMSSTSQRLYDSVIAPAPQWSSHILLTGEHLSGNRDNTIPTTLITGDNISKSLSGSDIKPEYPTTTGETISWNHDTFIPKTDTENTKESTTVILPSKWNLTYSQVISYLVDHYNLKNTSWKNTSFTNISKDNSIYPTFNIAASKGMIGASINPTSKVSCNTYMVLKWIAAAWKVSYKTGDPFSSYRTAAYNKWEVNWCTAGNFVTKATL